jgi:hypothetical protein
MKLTKSQLKQIIKEETQFVLKEAPELTDEEYEILDIGPSHPGYHRVARKANRLGISYAGPGTDKADFTHKDKMSAQWRRGAYEEFLKQIETERGRGAIAEPMIALGMDPSDTAWNGDRRKYKDMIGCLMGLQSHLDKIIEFEQDLIYKEYGEELSGERSAHDVRGELEKRCFEIYPNDAGPGRAGTPVNNSLDCIRYRGQRAGTGRQSYYGAEHLYDRVKLYNKIMGGAGGGRYGAEKCAAHDPQLLKKLVDVQADALRPMPAYTSAESEKELEKLNIGIDEILKDPRYQKIMKERHTYFDKFLFGVDVTQIIKEELALVQENNQ